MVVKNIPWFTLISWSRLTMERSGSWIAVMLLLWFIRISLYLIDGLRLINAVLQIRRTGFHQNDRSRGFLSNSHLPLVSKIIRLLIMIRGQISKFKFKYATGVRHSVIGALTA